MNSDQDHTEFSLIGTVRTRLNLVFSNRESVGHGWDGGLRSSDPGCSQVPVWDGIRNRTAGVGLTVHAQCALLGSLNPTCAWDSRHHRLVLHPRVHNSLYSITRTRNDLRTAHYSYVDSPMTTRLSGGRGQEGARRSEKEVRGLQQFQPSGRNRVYKWCGTTFTGVCVCVFFISRGGKRR